MSKTLRTFRALYLDNIEIAPCSKLIAQNNQYRRDIGKFLSFFDGPCNIVLLFYNITEVSCKSVGK